MDSLLREAAEEVRLFICAARNNLPRLIALARAGMALREKTGAALGAYGTARFNQKLNDLHNQQAAFDAVVKEVEG